MLKPLEQFKKVPGSKTWLDVVDSDLFQRAATEAMVSMQLQLNNAPDMATAAAYHWRMEGAKQILKILMSITEPTTAPNRPIQQNLTH